MQQFILNESEPQRQEPVSKKAVPHVEIEPTPEKPELQLEPVPKKVVPQIEIEPTPETPEVQQPKSVPEKVVPNVEIEPTPETPEVQLEPVSEKAIPQVEKNPTPETTEVQQPESVPEKAVPQVEKDTSIEEIKARKDNVSKASVRNPVSTEPQIKPKKSLEELKAELEQAKAAPPAPPALTALTGNDTKQAPSSTEGIEFDISTLDQESQTLFKAFEEKRMILSFQPVITFSGDEDDSDDEMHYVGLQQVDSTDNDTEESLRSRINSKDFQMYIDRWILREIIGTLSIKEKITDTFIVNISDASLADASFFTWFRTMLTGLDSKNLGKYILLEIDAKDLVTLEKQASALISYLRKSHNFSFVLGTVTATEEIISYTNKIKFDLVRCNSTFIKELQGIAVSDTDVAENDNNATHSQLDLLKSRGARLIADDIIDATTLTDVISLGSDHAMGEFIGEPVTQLDDVTNIESFEIV